MLQLNGCSPHYPFNSDTEEIIYSLIEHCKKVDLGNISFCYSDDRNTITFYLSEYVNNWQLVVVGLSSQDRDIYSIYDDVVKYLYSED